VIEQSPPPVINTSPLIFLTKADLLYLLEARYSTVLLPSTVANEIQQYGTSDLTYQVIQSNDWLVTVETPSIPTPIRACNLDPGESTVLAWAYVHPGTEAILDDLAGRRCANALQIPVRGTLGLVLAAKKEGEISAAKPLLLKLQEVGMYLSDRVISQALTMVEESLEDS